MKTSEFKPVKDHEKRMWGYMRRHASFRYAEVMKATDVSRHHMDCFAAKLRRAGLIKQVRRDSSGQYFTVMDAKAAAQFEAEKKGRKEGVIWTAMRSMRTFTPPELLLVFGSERADISEEDVRSYCGQLLKAEYLAVITKARPNVNPARYKLIKETGPLPPIKRTLEVIVDQNEDRAVYAAGARI